jgi:hypothetical protein
VWVMLGHSQLTCVLLSQHVELPPDVHHMCAHVTCSALRVWITHPTGKVQADHTCGT